MVPTAILFGLVLGRWWAIPVGAMLWVLLVLTLGSGGLGLAEALATAAVGGANVIVGVAIHQLARLVLRLARYLVGGGFVTRP